MLNCQVDIVAMPDDGRRYTDSASQPGMKKKTERRSSDSGVKEKLPGSPKVEKKKRLTSSASPSPSESPVGSPSK